MGDKHIDELYRYLRVERTIDDMSKLLLMSDTKFSTFDIEDREVLKDLGTILYHIYCLMNIRRYYDKDDRKGLDVMIHQLRLEIESELEDIVQECESDE